MARIFKSEEYGYVCELWGASTKHPDSIFFFSDFKKVDFLTDKDQIFQWLLECASKLTWPHQAKKLAEQAMRDWYPNEGPWFAPELEEWTKDHWHHNYR